MATNLQNSLFKLLFALSILSIVVSAIAASAFGYWSVRDTRAQTLQKYITERGAHEELKFVQVSEAQLVARKIFWKFYTSLDDEDIRIGMDRYFPVQADGTRRSADALFSGTFLETYGPVHGIGAFLSGQYEWTPERARILYSSFLTIMRVGTTLEDQLESFWFYTPNGDVIIFSPRRIDRLEFYRKNAPADFDISSAQLTSVSSFENNPDAKISCTPLTDIVYIQTGEALTTGCQTPVRKDSMQLGVFGTTLPMSGAFRESLTDIPEPSADLFFIRPDGQIIAHSSLLNSDRITRNAARELQIQLNTEDLADQIQSSENQFESTFSTTTSGFLPDLNAAYHLEIPDWYLVITIPGSRIFMDVLRQMIPILGLSIIMVILSLSLLGYFVRVRGIKPLQTLASAFHADRSEQAADPAVVLIAEKNKDEIGELARTLLMYKSRTDTNLAQLEELVKVRTRDINRANEAKSAFLATMSHELRTPMNGILGVAGALRRTQQNDQQQEMTELIWQSSQALERQLNDILDISKVEAGKLELERSACHIASVIKAIFDLNAPTARDKNIIYSLDISDDCQGSYLADPFRLRQIIGNLITNAIKFTEDGHVRVRVSPDGVAGQTHWIRIEVEDTGCGLDKKALSQVFDPFMQLDKKKTRSVSGTGLGLTIAKSLVELHGGQIGATSVKDEGSTFWCRLPMTLCKSREHVLIRPVEEALQGQNIPTPHLRVLLAEDHPVNQRVVQLILQPLGCTITIAENGQIAVDAFRDSTFDLILMDLQMPVMDGLEATRQIRDIEEITSRDRTPLFVLSASAMQLDIDEALAAGADQHLSKPVSPEKLISSITRMISENAFRDNSAAE